MLNWMDSLKGRSMMRLASFTDEEMLYLIDLAAQLKARRAAGVRGDLLHRKNIALIFEKSSTRTRNSCVVAARDEGGGAEYLTRPDIHFGKKESVKDTARVLGRTYDGILFLIDMDQRDWYLSPDGIGSEIFTSKKTDAIGQRIVPDLSNGSYYSAFDKLINEIEDALEYNEAHPVKQGGLDRGQVTLFLILTVIGIIIALIIVSSMKRKMKTQQIAVQANNYVRDGSLNMVNAVEVFQYSNVMKTPRQTSTTSSAPRTGSSSVGHSHGGGGGGKF